MNISTQSTLNYNRVIIVISLNKLHYFALVLLFKGCFLLGAQPLLAIPATTRETTKPDPTVHLSKLIKQGLEQLTSGHPEEALLTAQKAIELDQNSADAYFVRARAKHDIGVKDDALKDYDKSILLNPKLSKALINRALIKGGQGNLRGALNDLNLAIASNPSLANAFSNRGVTRGALNDRKGALEDFNKAISLNPAYADAFRNRGITRELLGDLKGACSDWKMAASLGQKDAANWYQNQCSK